MIVRTPAEIGILIRARRHELKLDQQALATRIGVSRLWVVEFERGKPRAEIGLVLRALIALDLGVDVSIETTADADADLRKKRPRIAAPPDIDAIVADSRKRR